MTSQIFANIYLNQFKRFVRHELKPLAYLRYGDDFILFLPNKEQAVDVQEYATEWLFDNQKLTIHAQNNVIVKAKRCLHFLGHRISTQSPLSVDPIMIRKIQQDISSVTIPSYRAMALPRRWQERLSWLLKSKDR